MAVKVMSWAWETKLKPTLKLTLLALADYSNDEGLCWPSIDSMVKKSSLARSSVIKNVQILCDLGVVEKQKRYENGLRTSNSYRLKVELSPESVRMLSGRPESVRMLSGRPGNDAQSPGNGLTTYIQTVIEPSLTKKHAHLRKSNRFAQFYAQYPIHKDRERARKAFEKLNPDDQLLNTMLEAMENQALEKKMKNNANEFSPDWKYPATWINQKCWTDEVELKTQQEKKQINKYWKCGACGSDVLKMYDYCTDCDEKQKKVAHA